MNLFSCGVPPNDNRWEVLFVDNHSLEKSGKYTENRFSFVIRVKTLLFLKIPGHLCFRVGFNFLFVNELYIPICNIIFF